ncbi:MAG: dihydrodipicolinate synthase family protein [Acidimicrobiaceae bacterium]|jgi:4-hydroxy-tetrahydrodipicolinate synthase|nr:dihydrodipicolinate synthase family protein [Acidimicrobiaceae bacterium]MBT5580511.1 dihydrodipicolinate synthase family protein [Acidimicrobiaceae bacterium]MBT5849932.1 dihydrodipicolinate synthase family protein [Acidimicrobiaceae bacterium]
MDTPLLHGVCAAMSSPFDDTGELLDEGRLRDHIESLIDAGVHGLVLCAGTGEFAFLSTEEKDRIIGLGCEIVDGRVPVITQTSAITTTDAIERTRKAADQGATAAMVLPPYFEGPFERGVLFHYEKLAQAIDIPIVLYNIPAQSGFDIHPDLYRQLIAMENIDYIKDSTGDLIRLQKLIGIGGHVLAGADPLAPFAAMAGAAGWIWGAANVMPQECVMLWDLVQKGDHSGALELWAKMLPANMFFWENNVDAEYNSAVKTATNMVGRPVGPCRRPVMPMTRQGRLALQTALSTLPVNGTSRDTLVYREWDDERDWLVQMTHTSGVSRAKGRS